MKINDKELNRLCKLSMLEVKQNERNKTLEELNGMVELLTELDCVCRMPKNDNGETACISTLRSDEVGASVKRDELLSVAPKCDDNSFIVKRVVE